MFGLYASDDAVMELYGTKTGIHGNKGAGIDASDHGTINIHLPFQHNTTHDNVGGDRRQHGGDFVSPGSIANINDDGTFTHT